jgi:hypothetical protein
MTDFTLQSLAERLDRLERHNARLQRENRLLRGAAVLAVAALAAAVCVGQVAVPKQVEAQKFVLRDADGKQRAVLAVARVWAQEGPSLKFYDAAGKERTILGVVDEASPTGVTGPVLYLLGQKGLPAIDLSVNPLGRPELYMRDARGHPRVMLAGVAEDFPFAGGLKFLGPNGHLRADLSLSDDGKSGFTLLDADGKSLFHAR